MSTLSPVLEEAPRFEAEEIQRKIGSVTNESLDSTRRMIAICEETEKHGVKTLTDLDDQDKKLDNIAQSMRVIHEDMTTADKTLQGMKGFGIRFPWSSKRGPELPAFKVNVEEAKKGGCDHHHRPHHPNQSVPSDSDDGGFITKYNSSAQEDEMDNNLFEVSNMIGNLRNMAIDIGTEIDKSNSKIEHINDMAEVNTNGIVNANEQTRKLLR